MGIKSINKLLRSQCPQVFRETHLSEFAQKRIAVDLSLFLHKYLGVGGNEHWLDLFLNLLCCLKRYRVTAIFVVEGKAPSEKDAERLSRANQHEKIERRALLMTRLVQVLWPVPSADVPPLSPGEQEQLVELGKKALKLPDEVSELRQLEPYLDRLVDIEDRANKATAHPTREILEQVKDVLNLLGTPVVQAQGEAETLCSHWARTGEIDGVVTEDTDVLAYGCPVFISKLNTNSGACVVIQHDELLQGLELKKPQFLDLCIMCGTDYNKNIPRIGPMKAYQLIKKHGNIEGIAQAGHDVTILSHQRGRTMFTEAPPAVEIPRSKPCNLAALSVLLYQLGSRYNFNQFQNLWAPAAVVFEEESNTSSSDSD